MCEKERIATNKCRKQYVTCMVGKEKKKKI